MHDDNTRPASRLEQALALLDPLSRRIMELWLQAATTAEIASQVALPERSVEVIGRRAFAKVRESIAQQAAGEPPSKEGCGVTSSAG